MRFDVLCVCVCRTKSAYLHALIHFDIIITKTHSDCKSIRRAHNTCNTYTYTRTHTHAQTLKLTIIERIVVMPSRGANIIVI